MKKIYILPVLLLISTIRLNAQDTINNHYQQEFDDFVNGIQQEFNTFKTKNDSVFYNFLKQNWQEFKLMETTRISTPKPVEQPVIKKAKQKPVKITPSGEHKTILEDSGRQIRYNNIYKVNSNLENAPAYNTLNFYGISVKIPETDFEWNSAKTVDKDQIAAFFKTFAGNDHFLQIIKILQSTAETQNLNGYGYLRLVQKTAAKYFNQTNNQVLFTWLALLKSGYDAKVGYNNQNIYLLVNFDTQVYYYSYIENEGKRYYLIPFSYQNKLKQPITSFPESYPGSKNPVSLIITQTPALPVTVKTRTLFYDSDTVFLKYNKNLKDFFGTYPDCDLSLYFVPAPSIIALRSLANYLNPLLKGKTTVEKVNILMDFMQRGFPYATDEKQFGKEKYMFAEETIAYPYSDCEDRAILLSHLIGFFTGQKTIGLAFPGHISLAVSLPGDIAGSYIEHDKKRYYICDPTYIGSKVGMIMPEYANSKPKIITFENETIKP